jgi:hypothetical protein
VWWCLEHLDSPEGIEQNKNTGYYVIA